MSAAFGVCRQCGKPRPGLGTITCGASACQYGETKANAIRAKMRLSPAQRNAYYLCLDGPIGLSRLHSHNVTNVTIEKLLDMGLLDKVPPPPGEPIFDSYFRVVRGG